jgi:hypothetical protein
MQHQIIYCETWAASCANEVHHITSNGTVSAYAGGVPLVMVSARFNIRGKAPDKWTATEEKFMAQPAPADVQVTTRVLIFCFG